MSIVIGLHAAAARAGLPRTSLRRLVAKGQLSATKARDGTWSFDADDLDQLRATRAESASAGSVVPTSPVSTTVSAPTAMPSTSPPPAAVGSFAQWMTAPADARDRMQAAEASAADAHVHEDDDAGIVEPSHEPPFWAAASAPMYPEGDPIVDPTTLMITYRPAGSNASTPGMPAPGTAGAVIAELQQQVARVQRELDAARAISNQWRTAWRAARTTTIAHAIMNEATNAGASPMCVDAAWRAAGTAADGLPDDQLANELHAMDVARAAGNAAAMRSAGGGWFAGPDLVHDGDHDLARARMRRSRSRSPRW